MPVIVVDVPDQMNKAYQCLGYPLGKSRRGYKKWVKRTLLRILKEIVRESRP